MSYFIINIPCNYTLIIYNYILVNLYDDAHIQCNTIHNE